MVESLEFIVNTMIFEGLAGRVREREMYKKHTSKMRYFPSSNRLKIDVKTILEQMMPK